MCLPWYFNQNNYFTGCSEYMRVRYSGAWLTWPFWQTESSANYKIETEWLSLRCLENRNTTVFIACFHPLTVQKCCWLKHLELEVYIHWYRPLNLVSDNCDNHSETAEIQYLRHQTINIKKQLAARRDMWQVTSERIRIWNFYCFVYRQRIHVWKLLCNKETNVKHYWETERWLAGEVVDVEIYGS